MADLIKAKFSIGLVKYQDFILYLKNYIFTY